MTAEQPTIKITLEQAQAIVSEYHTEIGDQLIQTAAQITSFVEESDQGYSHHRYRKTYRIDLANCSYALTVSLPAASLTSPASDYHPNDCDTVKHLHELITSQTSIPLPKILKTGTIVSPTSTSQYEFLLVSSPPTTATTLAAARQSGRVTPEADARIQRTIGAYLRQLHTLQNDWFGRPLPGARAPADPSYVWQEAFTLFLETVLCALEERGLEVPWQDLRRCLSRAIGYYVFDDAEVPSLVGVTVSEDDVYIRMSPPSASAADPEPEIVAFPLPTHALWGDPMMEAFFMPPGPSKALVEGYMAGEGGAALMPFARQRTKRLWYTLFLAGVVLLEAPEEGFKADGGNAEGKQRWARETFMDCVQKLNDAPCY
ncbi:hypothetical protein FIBSPDRAFT_829342 [Athelia psychrophila]|uniref:Aminoglycoside phosphotransferase domain-containing protein n=1 Tax=Athelia psychrophila TaxID=1759441 RepID=A0A166H655_9AGAM|nr:hypothetical protein FIBSPDRAFT_829342 [Fibularhizoctonia sp. CBS 109695]